MNEELLAKCSCAHCGNHIEFPLEAAGAEVGCPHCARATVLTLDAPPQSADKPSAAELLAAFTGPVLRTPVSFFYQVGLVLVTMMMVLLPLVYVGMVLALVLGVYLYGTHCFFLLEPTRGGGRLYLVKLAAYLGPIFIGAVLVFFMIKPLFARRAPHAQPLALNPAVESTLYAFIARICDLIGAPMPQRISLDCQLNAAAGFRGGLGSVFKNDLVLVIGIPLAGGLTLREFAGVIAHEFGHFTQGFGLRLSYIIRSINDWFARVVFGRDAWDAWLESWSMEADDWRVMLVANLARLGVGFSRLLLMGLMFIGHGVSCFLLRQMEYDADSYEIKLAGSAAFESTARRLAVLGKVLAKAYKEIGAMWKLNRRLPDNFAAYLCRLDSQVPPQTREQIEDTIGLSTTGLFDTHPSDGDRIRCARQAAEPGVFHLEMPASVLFSHFEVISRQVTQLHYSDDLGLDFDPAKLSPVNAAA